MTTLTTSSSLYCLGLIYYGALQLDLSLFACVWCPLTSTLNYSSFYLSTVSQWVLLTSAKCSLKGHQFQKQGKYYNGADFALFTWCGSHWCRWHCAVPEMEYLGWTVSPVTQTKVIMMKNIDYNQGLQHIRTIFKMINHHRAKQAGAVKDILSDQLKVA